MFPLPFLSLSPKGMEDLADTNNSPQEETETTAAEGVMDETVETPENNGAAELGSEFTAEADPAPAAAPAEESAPLDLGITSSGLGSAAPIGVGKTSAESEKALAEIKDKASQEKDQFYAERTKKIEAKKKQAM